jgi:hypothetical protein
LSSCFPYHSEPEFVNGRDEFHLPAVIAGVVVTSDKIVAGVTESIKIQDKALSPLLMTPAIIYRQYTHGEKGGREG